MTFLVHLVCSLQSYVALKINLQRYLALELLLHCNVNVLHILAAFTVCRVMCPSTDICGNSYIWCCGVKYFNVTDSSVLHRYWWNLQSMFTIKRCSWYICPVPQFKVCKFTCMSELSALRKKLFYFFWPFIIICVHLCPKSAELCALVCVCTWVHVRICVFQKECFILFGDYVLWANVIVTNSSAFCPHSASYLIQC